jgi:hypothetical protein
MQKYSGNMLYYIKNLKAHDIDNLDLKEITQYYMTVDENFLGHKTYLMSEPFLISLARLASPDVIKKSLDKFVSDFNHDITQAKDEKECRSIVRKHFLEDESNSFSFFIGALFEQEPEVIKEVISHFKNIDKSFMHKYVFAQENQYQEDSNRNQPLTLFSTKWIDEKEDKNRTTKLELMFDFFEFFFDKKKMPLIFLFNQLPNDSANIKNKFFNLVKNRKYPISQDLTCELIMQGEEYTLANETTIKESINKIILNEFAQSITKDYNIKNNKNEYKEYKNIEEFYKAYDELTKQKQDIIFYLAHASLTSVINNKIEKKYLDDLNQYLSSTKKSELNTSFKKYDDSHFFNETKINIETTIVHFITQLSLKLQKELIDNLANYPHINKLFKPILQQHYSAIVFEEIEHAPGSNEELTLATGHSRHMNSNQRKAELKNSRAFVEDILWNSLDLVSYIEKTLSQDGHSSEKFNKMKIKVEKKLLEKTMALPQKSSNKKLKI